MSILVLYDDDENDALTDDNFALTARALPEGLELVVVGEAAVHGQWIEGRSGFALQATAVLPQQIDTLVNLLHARQEDQDVAEALVLVDLDDRVHAGLDVIGAGLLQVENINRVGGALYAQDRRAPFARARSSVACQLVVGEKVADVFGVHL